VENQASLIHVWNVKHLMPMKAGTRNDQDTET